MNMWIIIVIVFFALLAIGCHIGIAMGVVGAMYVLFIAHQSPQHLPLAFYGYMHSYALMAVPLFLTAGYLMENTGIIRQLFDGFEMVFKKVPARLGVACMATCIVFASITGSSVAMVSAMAVFALPRMVSAGYPRSFAAGVITSGGTLGLLIPPSLSFIIYGIMTETSIAKLFIAGIVPGLVLGALLIIYIIIVGGSRHYGESEEPKKANLKNVVGMLPALFMPVIVLGGLYGGVFTPTEAGGAACAYALIYGFIDQKGKLFKNLPHITFQSLQLWAMVILLFGGAGIIATMSAAEYLPQKAVAWVTTLGLSATGFLITYMVLLLILGCFFDALTIIILTIGVAFPIAMNYGINPIHLGVLLVINGEIATITPPVGFNLFAMAGVGKMPITEVLRGSIPFYTIIFCFMWFVLFYPPIALVLTPVK